MSALIDTNQSAVKFSSFNERDAKAEKYKQKLEALAKLNKEYVQKTVEKFKQAGEMGKAEIVEEEVSRKATSLRTIKRLKPAIGKTSINLSKGGQKLRKFYDPVETEYMKKLGRLLPFVPDEIIQDIIARYPPDQLNAILNGLPTVAGKLEADYNKFIDSGAKGGVLQYWGHFILNLKDYAVSRARTQRDLVDYDAEQERESKEQIERELENRRYIIKNEEVNQKLAKRVKDRESEIDKEIKNININIEKLTKEISNLEKQIGVNNLEQEQFISENTELLKSIEDDEKQINDISDYLYNLEIEAKTEAENEEVFNETLRLTPEIDVLLNDINETKIEINSNIQIVNELKKNEKQMNSQLNKLYKELDNIEHISQEYLEDKINAPHIGENEEYGETILPEAYLKNKMEERSHDYDYLDTFPVDVDQMAEEKYGHLAEDEEFFEPTYARGPAQKTVFSDTNLAYDKNGHPIPHDEQIDRYIDSLDSEALDGEILFYLKNFGYTDAEAQVIIDRAIADGNFNDLIREAVISNIEGYDNKVEFKQEKEYKEGHFDEEIKQIKKDLKKEGYSDAEINAVLEDLIDEYQMEIVNEAEAEVAKQRSLSESGKKGIEVKKKIRQMTIAEQQAHAEQKRQAKAQKERERKARKKAEKERKNAEVESLLGHRNLQGTGLPKLVKFGRGLYNTRKNEYIRFGIYKINLSKLYEQKLLQVLYNNEKRQVMPICHISDNLFNVIDGIIRGKKFDITKLTQRESKFLRELIKKSGVMANLNLVNKYNILNGELEAGNDNVSAEIEFLRRKLKI